MRPDPDDTPPHPPAAAQDQKAINGHGITGIISKGSHLDVIMMGLVFRWGNELECAGTAPSLIQAGLNDLGCAPNAEHLCRSQVKH